MNFHTIASDFYDDEKVLKLDIQHRYLFIFLFSNRRCGLSGIYKISPISIANESGYPSLEIYAGLKLLEELGLISYDFDRNYLWVVGKMKVHKNTWSNKFTLKAIKNDLQSAVATKFYHSFYEKYPRLAQLAIDIESPGEGYEGKEGSGD